MTDRVKGFIVTLDHEIREDDVEPILDAIRMIKHVVDVRAVIANSGDLITTIRVKHEILKDLSDFIKERL